MVHQYLYMKKISSPTNLLPTLYVYVVESDKYVVDPRKTYSKIVMGNQF